MRSALANPGSAVAAQGFLSVPGILQSQELTSLQQQGVGCCKVVVELKWFSGNLVLFFFLDGKMQMFEEDEEQVSTIGVLIEYGDHLLLPGCSYLEGIRINLDRK